MARARIFISSTCFDLTQVREDIRNCLMQIGHDPLLSEYPSFPVLPDLQTIENCKRNVRENTDIFVLIIGGKRGSVDIDSNKPITNIEYETAKQCGIDTFVFVLRSVQNLLPVWEKNPTADFTPQVDYPEVFTFINKIQSEQKWMFTFDRASEIAETLRTQLSVFLRSLVERKRQSKLIPIKEFARETKRAQEIALHRPEYWEFLLTEELLRTNLAPIKRSYDDLKRGLIYRKSRSMKGHEYLSWLRSKIRDQLSLIKLFEVAFAEELTPSLNEPAESIDPLEIKRAVDKLISGCNDLLDWEVDFVSVCPPDGFQKINELMQGLTAQFLEEVQRVPDELATILSKPNLEGHFTIVLKYELRRSAEIREELRRLVSHPEEYQDEF